MYAVATCEHSLSGVVHSHFIGLAHVFFDELSALDAYPVDGGFGEGYPFFVVFFAVCVDFDVFIGAYSCDGDDGFV